ncbi:MAG: hypothetical protein WC393_03855 [Candidatus Nanoarchaeia archaeon]|jgi:hypothetical protein
MIDVIEYGDLVFSNKNKTTECEYLINNTIYYFRNNKVCGFQTADLAIKDVSLENIHMFSKTPCQKYLLNILSYCRQIDLKFNPPLKVLLKNPELNRLIHVDNHGHVRSYDEAIQCPRELVIKMPESKIKEVRLDEIIQALP